MVSEDHICISNFYANPSNIFRKNLDFEETEAFPTLSDFKFSCFIVAPKILLPKFWDLETQHCCRNWLDTEVR